MCGICGIVDYSQKVDLNTEKIRSMCDAMEHRGPDGDGYYRMQESDFSVGLGHRRLKIIDLSEAGRQPMSNEDKSVWLVFNGEVYNYKDLRIELKSKGHIFKSNTDTETVVHLYEEYGKECVKFLRGMYAFALWDERRKIMLLARDRVGKKPLLYSYSDGVFCFASEFASLLASGLIKKEINYQAINYYLAFGYIPAPLTIYNNVFKIMPGHILILKDKQVVFEQYWHLDYTDKLDLSEEEAAGEALRLLREAVKVRLYSDVPLGAFLSGGIDSSTVVALMTQLSDTRVKTFSIGFEEKDYSELQYARNVAAKFNTEHHEFIVRPDALGVLPLLVERYGEPYADSSCIPTYYVARETKRYVTVALNGDGGDECFAGYERYQAMLSAENYQKIPALVKKVISRAAQVIPDSINPKNRLRNIRRFFEGAAMPFEQRYLRWVSIFDEISKRELYSAHFNELVSKSDSLHFISPFLNNRERLSILDCLLYTDTMTYLPGDLLVKVDITSMANSLEGRSPFLDHKFMEFVARLPAEYKLKRWVKKYLLKKAIKDLVPKNNIYRRKMGFGVPVGRWFRQELRGFLKENLLSEIALKRGYFRPETVKFLVSEHIQGRKDYAFKLWALLMLELWHQRFID